jgi:hypothetical protein
MPLNARVREDLSRGQTASINQAFNPSFVDPSILRAPEYEVFVYSISRRSHYVQRPPVFSKLLIVACPADERYCMVARFPHPFTQLDRDMNGSIIAVNMDGQKVAQGICNPNNLTDNQDLGSDRWLSLGDDGSNLSKKGVFWSLNNPPEEHEIAAAEKRLDNYHRQLLNEADSLALTDPKKLQERLTTNLDYRLAADAFGEEHTWHKLRARGLATVNCANCGESIKSGVAFHRDQDGDLCVLDWKRTVDAGKKTRADVPAGREWWTAEAAPAPVEEMELVAAGGIEDMPARSKKK